MLESYHGRHMATQQDYYSVLGIRKGASEDEIKKAYRTLARELHPDVNDAADAQERFQKVSEAYEVLSDPQKRAQYDRFGHAGVGAGGSQASGFGGSGGFGGADFGSMFEEIFGGGVGGGGFRNRGNGSGGRHRKPQRPQHETEMSITFQTAVKGGSETLRMTTAAGPREIEVTIPSGISDGQRLRVKDKDADVLITVSIGNHPFLKREGLDLLVELPLTIVEATLGCSVEVPMLKGSVELTVHPGADSGQRLRVPGHGIQSADGTTGDFFAVIKIVSPTTLTDDELAALKVLGPALENPRTASWWPISEEGNS